MSEIVDVKFGRIHFPDSRDYPATELLAGLSDNANPITKQYWYDNIVQLDQGTTSQCTAYSWSQWLKTSPVYEDITGNDPVFLPAALYQKFQENDGIPGVGTYNGSTVRSGAKVLRKLGVIDNYYFAQSVDDIIKALLYFGPIVVGTSWFEGMMHPDPVTATVKPTGRNLGGHAYLLTGVDTETGLIRIKNSWGLRYGDKGHVFISIEDFTTIYSVHGEACVALKNKLTTIPKLDSIISDDTNNG